MAAQGRASRAGRPAAWRGTRLSLRARLDTLDLGHQEARPRACMSRLAGDRGNTWPLSSKGEEAFGREAGSRGALGSERFISAPPPHTQAHDTSRHSRDCGPWAVLESPSRPGVLTRMEHQNHPGGWSDRHRWQGLAPRAAGSGGPGEACHACVLSHVRLCEPGDCSPPGSSVHGIPQATILEWVAVPFSRGSSQPRDQTCISRASCIGRRAL